MANDSQSPDIRPPIFGLNDLFLERESWGWRKGTKLLISGPPGAGKTTFALSLVRAQVKAPEQKTNQSPGKKQHIRVYYLSPEVDRDRLNALYASRGWFVEEDVFSLSSTHSTKDFAVAFCPISPRVEFDRPVRSSEDIINDILHRIRQDNLHAYPHDELKLFIIVDSITALLRDCPNTGEERRKTHELLLRLQAAFPPESVQLTILLAEADEGTVSATSVSVRGEAHVWPQQTLVAIEDYLVDVVFRLSLRREHQGDRTRVLDVSKSQGTNMAIGEHTWAIITDTNYKTITGLRNLQVSLQRKEAANPHWGTIAIFPNPFTATLLSSPSSQTQNAKYISAGTRRLDELIRVEAAKGVPRGLRAGSTTLFVGPPGSGTTYLALQFLFPDSPKDEQKNLKNKNTGTTCSSPKDALYISFDARGKADLEAFKKAQSMTPEPVDQSESNDIFRSRDRLDINILIAEVRAALETPDEGEKNRDSRKTQIARVAIDGISDWLAGEHPQEVADLVEALLKTIREYSVSDQKHSPTIAIAYDHVESVEPDDPLAPSSLGLSADNIVVVRQIHIQDQRHRIIYVVKSETEASPMVRELEVSRSSVERWRYAVGNGLDGYTDLLTDRPKPATITLQLFGENQAQDDYNSRLIDHLRSLYGYDFKPYHFSRSEIESTLNDVNSQTRVLAADLKLVTLDEWWIGQLKPRNGRYALTALNDVYSGDLQTHLSDGHMFNPSKYWIPEIEKATHIEAVSSNVEGEVQDGKPSRKHRTRIFACPLTLDFGILCFNPFATLDKPDDRFSWDRIRRTLSIESRHSKKWSDTDESEFVQTEDAQMWEDFWSNQARRVPRYWTASQYLRTNVLWFSLGDVAEKDTPKTGPKTVVEFLGRILKKNPSAIGFAFDSVTRETACCVLFELAWAFGAPEHFLVPEPETVGQKRRHRKDFQDPLKKALLFLQFMIVEKLMPANPTLMQTSKAILSRQFYSTRRYVHEHLRELHPKTPFHLIPLPLMPTGMADNGKEVAKADNIRRCRLLIDRLRHRLNAIKANYPNDSKVTNTLEGIVQEADELARQAESGRPNSQWLSDLDTLVNSAANLQEIEFQAEPDLEKEFTASFGLDMHAAARTSLDRRDILELQHWAHLRQEIQTGKDLFLKNAGIHGSYGYGCSGSWMLGIHSSTRSPSLAKDLMSEIASLKFAEKRALNCAGIPARKDFYAFHGKEPVPDAPYFSWDRMFRFSAATARRRDKAICANVPAPRLFRELHHVMMQCMSEADRLSDEYGRNRNNTVKRFNRYIDTAVASLFNRISALAVREEGSIACRSCVSRPLCGLVDPE